MFGCKTYESTTKSGANFHCEVQAQAYYRLRIMKVSAKIEVLSKLVTTFSQLLRQNWNEVERLHATPYYAPEFHFNWMLLKRANDYFVTSGLADAWDHRIACDSYGYEVDALVEI